MKDEEIVDLYWARSETAISETSDKYGRYCHAIAYNILYSDEDSEECVSSCWFSAWNAMPDLRPVSLRAFLGKTVRNLALKRWEEKSAQKRGSGQVAAALDELSECVPAPNSGSRFADDLALTYTNGSNLDNVVGAGVEACCLGVEDDELLGVVGVDECLQVRAVGI